VKDVELSSVLVAVKFRLVEFSAMLVADRLISVGAALLAIDVAAVDTDAASVRVMEAATLPGAAFYDVDADFT